MPASTGNQSVLLKASTTVRLSCASCCHELEAAVPPLLSVQLRSRRRTGAPPHAGQNRPRHHGIALGAHVGIRYSTFVVDAPQGGGRPLLPNYMLAHGNGQVVLRNYRGRRFTYHEGEAADQVINAVCRICGTDHSDIAAGPAADDWNTRRPGYSATTPAGEDRNAAMPRDRRRNSAHGTGLS